MPILANIEVNAAKTAERIANSSHILFFISSFHVCISGNALLPQRQSLPSEFESPNIDKKVLVLKNNAYLCNPIRAMVLWPSG